MSLTEFIERDLKARILSGEDVPENLSLADLSNHYGVSITPVRDAISALVDQKFVDKMPNRRLKINTEKIGAGSPPGAFEPPRVPSDWGEILLEEVMVSSLNSRGVYLRETFLAQKYSVGRSIIRQTFSRFAGAGLLEHVPRKGWLVHPLNRDDVSDYLYVREVLELQALDLSKDKIKKSDVVSILESESHALNNSLHRYLIEASGNRYIGDFFQQYVSRYYTKLFHFAAPEISVVDEMTNQHEEILGALIDKSWDSARALLANHIQSQQNVLQELLVSLPQSVE